ncbi:DUF1642 domain-containing protein [Streptococcus sp. zg-86]|uniref:DUF1642 domain-containing protein n=1 Tax=Streptococcus zhangguiae TaxID=2664091 RepID=A0A6I4R8H3_9STRE|nr:MULTISPECIES: DUF1642 domain-containing protein [unclassified Streptococcus]MTB64098.1 DUF1642 domain-containing protein [Streptococcus sp. zg-86]MTB90576.1 DUF1642 domain-containing protein [Streptococcus sp. zg-36]MWV56086.1 DUF1642 domain-containing protein [Streptococcus sp. zg-70]QTH48285.1 DUF1642 domain-containing protein [Streptococcus sp. zg-86]
MNKQEAIKTGDRVITRGVVVRNFEGYGGCQFSEVETDKGATITCATEHLEPDEPQKVKVSQVAVDYYEQYKDKLSGFDEWFCDFYSSDFENDFDKAEELQIWLYDNDDKTNCQRELALATLIVNGLDAVEVEQEKKYKVKIANNGSQPLTFKKLGPKIFFVDEKCDESFTKQELEQAGFGWVFDCDGAEVEEVE